MKADTPTRVMLVDDHPIVRAGYARLIEQADDMRIVAEAANADESLSCLRGGVTPDVVVTDLSMPPGPYGIALIGQVQALLPACRVIVFSMHDSPGLVRRALQAGASGFLTKSSAPDLLVPAIRAVRRGQIALSPGLDAPAGAAADAQRLATLSEREFELFRRLALGESLADCARALALSPKTAANYQTLVREKLGVTNSAALAHLAMRCGVIEPLPRAADDRWPGALGQG